MIRKRVPILMCAVFCVLLVTPVLAYNAFRDGNFESWTGPWTLQGYDSYGWGVWVSESDWSYLGPANLADGVYQSPSHSFRSFGSNPMSIWQTIAWGGGPITYYVSSSGSYTVTVYEADTSSGARTGAVSFGPMILNETISPENVSAKTLNASEINMTTGIAVSSARSSWQQRNFTPSGSPRSLVVTFTTTTPNLYIDDIYTDRQLPVANFTGSPTSGTAPLTVQFSDTSTGTPTSWSWSFGDGGTSAVQNASHTYTSAGTYTVNLTVANAAGNNTVTKEGYVTVSQTQFYVFAEGVGLYHGTQDDLSLGNETPEDFYDLINGQCGTVDTEKCWNGRGLYVDDSAGSLHWNTSEQAGSYADNADFSLFVGHGANDR
ncbi:MAG: PKD domain-containing protein, partial [Methanoregulaceae archaeon]